MAGVDKMNKTSERGLKLSDFLTIEPMLGSKLVAGKKNESTIINRVNIVGSPEVDQFVRAQELIMTTGYPFRDAPEDLVPFIEKLNKKKVAGLGIKVKRFINEIPEAVIKRAEELGFPLIEIPPGTIFSDVVRVAMEEVFYQESEHLGTIYDRLQRFTDLIAMGTPIIEVVAELEQMIGNPIIVLDLNGNLLAPTLSNILEGSELTKLSSELELRLGTGIRNFSIREENFKAIGLPLSDNSTLSITPFIASLETNFSFTDIDFLTLEKIRTLLHMELTHLHVKSKMEEKYIDQYIKNLIRGELIAEEAMEKQPFEYKLHNKWIKVFILKMYKQDFTKEDITLLKNTLNRLMDIELLTTWYDGQLVIIVGHELEEKIDNTLIYIEEELVRFFKYKKKDLHFNMCIGSLSENEEGVKESYLRANEVMKIMDSYPTKTIRVYFEEMRIYRLLYQLPQTEEVLEYPLDVLGPLLRDKRKDIYIETLESYFQLNKNIKETADQLFTHYNTVVYRLDKIKQLLKVNLDDPEVTLEIQVALKLLK